MQHAFADHARGPGYDGFYSHGISFQGPVRVMVMQALAFSTPYRS